MLTCDPSQVLDSDGQHRTSRVGLPQGISRRRRHHRHRVSVRVAAERPGPGVPTAVLSPTRHVEHVMGTVFSIHVADLGDWAVVIADAVTFLHWVDRTFSTYRTDSQISRLHRREMKLRDRDEAVSEVLSLRADEAASDGSCNATIGGVLDPSGVVKGWAIERVSTARPGGSGWRIPCDFEPWRRWSRDGTSGWPPREAPSGAATSSIHGPVEHSWAWPVSP